ncbi:hypothetical protein OSB04_028419 [Centaurea solstitialis]|uniref:Uncharacterized protein n=1 Tax=Centaurea solstitialis TaxID=347529 RepID=A0AA38T0I9_9ASTR|nr:hypothetical protein OSB04_028419 [Centaurea solstitialis]
MRAPRAVPRVSDALCENAVFGWLIDGGQRKAAVAAGVLFRQPAALAVGGGCRKIAVISVTGLDVGCGVTLSSQRFTAILGCRDSVAFGVSGCRTSDVETRGPLRGTGVVSVKGRVSGHVMCDNMSSEVENSVLFGQPELKGSIGTNHRSVMRVVEELLPLSLQELCLNVREISKESNDLALDELSTIGYLSLV